MQRIEQQIARAIDGNIKIGSAELSTIGEIVEDVTTKGLTEGMDKNIIQKFGKTLKSDFDTLPDRLKSRLGGADIELNQAAMNGEGDFARLNAIGDRIERIKDEARFITDNTENIEANKMHPFRRALIGEELNPTTPEALARANDKLAQLDLQAKRAQGILDRLDKDGIILSDSETNQLNNMVTKSTLPNEGTLKSIEEKIEKINYRQTIH